MTQIIGFAGKKQAGKNTACNYVMAKQIYKAGVARNCGLNDNGDIIVSDLFGETDPDLPVIPLIEEFVPNISMFFEEFKPCKMYALADPLKRFAIDVFGFEEEKVYGTDNDKKTKTHLKWQDMPGVTTEKTPKDKVEEEVAGRLGKYYEKVLSEVVYHPRGNMTIREFLQFFGTEICRRLEDDVWVNTLLRRIKKDNPQIALVCDVRFDNEIKRIQKEGGIVVGLKRDIYQGQDTHKSEQINFDLCDFVIDNNDLDISNTSLMIEEKLKKAIN